MEAPRLLGAASRCCLSSTRTRLAQQHTGSVQIVLSRRGKSTAARAKRALNIPPHPSFLPDQTQDHIIFNPPSSAPSVFHTPFKFLPKSDPRRRANLTALFGRSTTIDYDGDRATVTALPTVRAESQVPRHHLTKEDVEEIRRLRASDPNEWSVSALAKKFNCAPMFVMMCSQATEEKLAQQKQKVEQAKARWGPIRAKAREDRRRRKEMIYRGEL